MATLGLIEYDAASPEVRAVYDDIMATRKTDWSNNFWKAIAHDPVTLRRTWLSVKEVMAPGALEARTKEMLYLAVSSSNQCGYCIASHTAAARKAGICQLSVAILKRTSFKVRTLRAKSESRLEVVRRWARLLKRSFVWTIHTELNSAHAPSDSRATYSIFARNWPRHLVWDDVSPISCLTR
jgi:AhpD family alkylhydroperoxidase